MDFAQEQARVGDLLALKLAQYSPKFATPQVALVGQYTTSEAVLLSSPSVLQPPPPPPPSTRQQEEYEEWDGLSDTGSSSHGASMRIPNPPIPGLAAVSVDALQSHVNEFAKENGFGVVRRNGSGRQARKTTYVFQCDRFGEPRTLEGAGLRKRRSRHLKALLLHHQASIQRIRANPNGSGAV